MSVQRHDTAALRDLERSLADLAQFCQTLQLHAEGASQQATAAWGGAASLEFMHKVTVWSAGATVMREGAVDLQTWVAAAATNYEAAQTRASSAWAG
ncbi:hypothetical protein [Glaciibacter psychrotolerans]|uniref:Uncharacterized protein YukE n=1 Tax=Glaciibacter psychrotolerans TaxID=670054 RepID=A0A7Z0EFZ5_9MICO|nr:hypothetical protein [Leifsonia psychrotolerans]NYJ20967.1 uncharacterized protein YukE [Leifsonia psychrotolerans]